jgi:membrane-bound serine protease (ClpP class)
MSVNIRFFLFLPATLFFYLCLFSYSLCYPARDSGGPARSEKVLLITVNGVINPVAAEYISDAVVEASERKAEALIIQLNTPGGLDSSMRTITRDIISSRVPVVVYVAPSGSRAASAGVFITMAAHVAAMAPGTNIGAAHPVQMGGEMDKVMSQKVTNDAAAYIRTLAEQRGRNAQWAEDSVRNSVSITESEALKMHVVELVARDIQTLLSGLDGRRVTLIAGEKVLKTAGARVVEHEMSLRLKILDLISNPDVAYILLLLGFYGLFFELTNPGAVFPGVMGGICLILGFYALQTLPVNYAGLMLIILGLVLFILEVKIVSHGVLTIGGITALIFGSLLLFKSSSPLFRLSLTVIFSATFVTALLFICTVRLVYKAYRRRPVTGAESLIGLHGTAVTDISRKGGSVRVHGELWAAFSDEPIPKDNAVVIESVHGLQVRVKDVK